MFTLLTFCIGVLVAIIIPRVVGVSLLRVPAFIALGVLVVYTGFASLWAGVLIALSPFIVGLVILLYFYWLGRRALSGKMGEPQKWMAEMVQADDTQFIQSMEMVDEMDMKEIAVIADTKDELRQLVIERAAEDGEVKDSIKKS